MNALNINLNFDAVKKDGRRHVMWQQGEWSIQGYAGEFGNVSLTVFRGQCPLYSTYVPRNAIAFIEKEMP